jgi:sigma-B regulation protein RsbU (phosphoserine phosphatase)
MPLAIGSLVLLILLVVAITVAVNRIVLVPLFKLTDSVRSIGQGNYDIQLPPDGTDEMGELTRAFGAMAAQVRSHTDELESKVAQRTRELVEVNKQVSDSIQCASLIQNAILPHHDLTERLSQEHFVMWKPRDVVGGDFYVFRSTPRGYLIGVVDCAGHGVPGAFMTMIAYAVLNVALDGQGLENPAALLTEMDAKLRALFKSDSEGVATNMDAGLAYVDMETKVVTFSGAKISLYWSDGQEVGELKGGRNAVGGKRIPVFENKSAPLDHSTFYLTTDGLLDQAGGPKGFSFGGTRFAELLKLQANRDLEQQKEAFARELAEYQGELSQRDDITLISFRFA